MIAARQKSLRLLLLSVALCSPSAALWAAPESRAGPAPVVADWRTGVAIHGLDPVAYFVDGAPREGREDVELVLDGVTWRFRSDANRAAFAAHPEVYRPRFGGYDPLPIARGVATPGNPLIWLIHDGRLYLFHDVKNRAAFAADPAAVLKASEANWPQVEASIVP